MTSLLEAYSPVATALRTMWTISGGNAILIFSAVLIGSPVKGRNTSYHHSKSEQSPQISPTGNSAQPCNYPRIPSPLSQRLRKGSLQNSTQVLYGAILTRKPDRESLKAIELTSVPVRLTG